MNKQQVITKIGKENWETFSKFMKGQTVGFDKGVVDYYEDDVDTFVRALGRTHLTSKKSEDGK